MNKSQNAIAASAVIGETTTDATLDALNRELSRKGIQADRIVSVLFVPGQPVANGMPSKFRVLYRL